MIKISERVYYASVAFDCPHTPFRILNMWFYFSFKPFNPLFACWLAATRLVSCDSLRVASTVELCVNAAASNCVERSFVSA